MLCIQQLACSVFSVYASLTISSLLWTLDYISCMATRSSGDMGGWRHGERVSGVAAALRLQRWRAHARGHGVARNAPPRRNAWRHHNSTLPRWRHRRTLR